MKTSVTRILPAAFILAVQAATAGTARRRPGSPYALAHGDKVSHWTVGDEVYRSWEYDLRAAPHDAATCVNALADGNCPQMRRPIRSVKGRVTAGCGPAAGCW